MAIQPSTRKLISILIDIKKINKRSLLLLWFNHIVPYQEFTDILSDNYKCTRCNIYHNKKCFSDAEGNKFTSRGSLLRTRNLRYQKRWNVFTLLILITNNLNGNNEKNAWLHYRSNSFVNLRHILLFRRWERNMNGNQWNNVIYYIVTSINLLEDEHDDLTEMHRNRMNDWGVQWWYVHTYAFHMEAYVRGADPIPHSLRYKPSRSYMCCFD